MSLASLVLRIHPQRRSSAEAALTAFPGVECHGMSEDGRLIVTVEDAPGAAMSETLIAIHRIPEVLAATLAFEADDALLADILAALDRARRTPQWMKSGGEFIPHASTWLNAKGWEDSLPVERPAPSMRDPIFAGCL